MNASFYNTSIINKPNTNNFLIKINVENPIIKRTL